MLALRDNSFFRLLFGCFFSSRRKHFLVLNVWFCWEKLQIMFRKKKLRLSGDFLAGWKKINVFSTNTLFEFLGFFYFQNISTIFYHCLFSLCSLFCTNTNSFACASLSSWPVADSSVMAYSAWNYILHEEASLSLKVVINVVQFSNASAVQGPAIPQPESYGFLDI